MTRVICRVAACVFWEQGICTADEIEYEPDEGCLTGLGGVRRPRPGQRRGLGG